MLRQPNNQPSLSPLPKMNSGQALRKEGKCVIPKNVSALIYKNDFMIILGIDPGTATTGYGIIDYEKSKFNVLDYGCILTKKDLDLADRIYLIADELGKIIKKFHPRIMAVEEIFYFKNAKTVISVSQARGAILLTGKKRRLTVFEFTPLQVKQAVVGYGKADKRQVQAMVKAILKLKKIPRPDDAADALAIAICAASNLKFKSMIEP